MIRWVIFPKYYYWWTTGIIITNLFLLQNYKKIQNGIAGHRKANSRGSIASYLILDTGFLSTWWATGRLRPRKRDLNISNLLQPIHAIQLQRKQIHAMQRHAAQRSFTQRKHTTQRYAAQRSSTYAAFKSNMHMQRSAAQLITCCV